MPGENKALWQLWQRHLSGIVSRHQHHRKRMSWLGIISGGGSLTHGNISIVMAGISWPCQLTCGISRNVAAINKPEGINMWQPSKIKQPQRR